MFVNNKNPNKRISLKSAILIPVIVLCMVALLSNVAGIINISKVNRSANQIVNDEMNKVSDLNEIQYGIQNLLLPYLILQEFLLLSLLYVTYYFWRWIPSHLHAVSSV
mgnify:CR=1 FL=1